jgi:hypothetical protein
MSLATKVTDLATRMATEAKALRTLINGNAADLSSLTTSNKGHLVAAINEVNAKPSGGTPADASETVKGIVELATLAEMATGTDTVRAVTPAGVRQERIALKSEILGAGVPAALDTLDELAAALGDDANYQATVTTALGNRVRVDTASQGLTTTQQGNARTNIDVYSKTEIGNPETDFVAVFNAGLV